MKPLALLVLESSLLFVVFRSLSSARAGLPAAVRIVLGGLVVFLLTVATLWLDCGPVALLVVAASVAIGSTGIAGDGLAKFGLALGRYRFPVYLLSAGTAASLVFVFVPITTFLTSPGEIGLHLDYLLTVNVRDGMVIVYVAAALYALAPSERMKTALALSSLATLLLVLAYSYVLPFGYPLMTGLVFEQIPVSPFARMVRVMVDFAVVAAVALGLYWGVQRIGARSILVGILLANISLAVAAALGARGEHLGAAGGADSGERLPERPLRFSRSEPNVLIIFLDRFMGSYIESIMETDPQLADRLTGFTWYPRTVSAGENSIAGVHPMLGGYDYTPVEMNARHRPLRDLSVEAFSILPYNFSKRSYQVSVVNPGGLGFTMAGDCSYLEMDGSDLYSYLPVRGAGARRANELSLNGDLRVQLRQSPCASRIDEKRAVLGQRGRRREGSLAAVPGSLGRHHVSSLVRTQRVS